MTTPIDHPSDIFCADILKDASSIVLGVTCKPVAEDRSPLGNDATSRWGGVDNDV